MKVLRYAFLAVVLALCVVLALANRAPVTLALWPDTISAFVGFGYAVTVPVFVLVGGALGAGLVLGLIWEWLRERGLRAEGARARRELDRLQAGSGAAAATTSAPRDQVLAILDSKDR